MKKLTFLFLFALLLLPVISALPTPTIIQQNGWQVTQDTESDFFGFEFDKNKQQTQICVLSETATKLNDLDSHFTYTNLETNETEQLNRKKVKQVDSGLDKDYYGFCRNFNTEKKIKFGDNSIIYEWINNTFYVYDTDQLDIEPFQIEVLCNDVKLETPDISWISNEPITEGVKFSANVENFTCDGKITFRQNKLIESNTFWDNQFGSETESQSTNYLDFEESSLNNITSKEIVEHQYNEHIGGWTHCLSENWLEYVTCLNSVEYYNINYYGIFTDLDPSLTQTITTSTSGYYNQTEASIHGVRLPFNSSLYNATPAYNYSTGNYTSLVFYNSTSTYWNTTFSIADSTGGYEVNLTDPNLVSYWALDENFLDSVGGNDGTANGDIVNATGLSSGAMRFDGVSDYVDLNGGSYINPNEPFTISGWMNVDSFANYGRYYVQASTTNGNPIVGVGTYNNNNFRIYLRNDAGASKVLYTNEDKTTGEWYNIVATYDGSTNYYLYVNGVEENTDATGDIGTSTFDTISIGAMERATVAYFVNGSIDEVRIYNKSLSSSEITELYKAGLSQHANANVTLETRVATSYNVSDAGLVGLWGLNGNANDELGVDNGTVTGVVFNEGNGTVGEGGYFDDTAYINTTNANLGKTDGNITISTWVKTSSNGINTFVANREVGGDASGWTLIKDDSAGGNIVIFQADVGASFGVRDGTLDIADGKWHHIVGTRAGSNFYVYVDGIRDDGSETTNAGTAVSTSPWIIGKNPRNDVHNMNGSIDEVRIYNRSLSADEIQNLYELGSYHIEWGDWTEEQKVEDGVPVTNLNSTAGNFFQFKDVFATNDTDVSAYVLNYSVEESDYVDDDTTATIIYPTATTYTSQVTELNYSYTNTTTINNCWWGDGTTNSSVNCFQNITGITSVEGSNTWTIYINDSNAMVGSDSVTFTVDLPPVITIVNPTTADQDLVFNHTQTCTDTQGVSQQWYTWKGVNTTYTETIALNNFAGTWTLYAYCNDTLGSVVSDSVTFLMRDSGSGSGTFTPGTIIWGVRNYTTGAQYMWLDRDSNFWIGGNMNVTGCIRYNGGVLGTCL